MKRLILLAVVVLGLAQATSAHADALLRITPIGQSVSGYTGPTGPVPIGSDGFRLTFHGGGSQTLVNPVMLIFGIPDLSLPAPSVTVSSMYGGFNAVNIDLGDTQASRYGGTWDPNTGYAGNFNSTTNSKVYDFIGFPKGSDSENYTNWSGATGKTSWNLFVYALTFSPSQMMRGDYVEFRTSLPLASFVLGYGCERLSGTGSCSNAGATDSTPFTFAGMVTVPEPTTIGLLLPGLALVLARMRRKTR